MITSIIATWIFSGLIYQGKPFPLPNPNLKIYFQFDDKGTDTLLYFRDGEQGHCRRSAQYTFATNQLTQTVTWIDPDNAEWCAQDPDMQMGAKSTTAAWFEDGHLHLQFQMGDQDIIYVWDKLVDKPK
ncbi:MAG TPA: hypothetical protein VN132_14035 [Bdellovibrio sp.]|nr:hypothetical protein [Bdellovibrio sp.]